MDGAAIQRRVLTELREKPEQHGVIHHETPATHEYFLGIDNAGGRRLNAVYDDITTLDANVAEPGKAIDIDSPAAINSRLSG